MAGTIEGHAGARHGLRLDGGMAYDLGKGERCGVTGEIAMLDLSDRRRVGGAPLRNRREPDSRAGRFSLLHLHHAMMCAVPSAAGGQIRIGDRREGQHRRDQRKAEEQKQCDADKTSHSAILMKLRVDCCEITYPAALSGSLAQKSIQHDTFGRLSSRQRFRGYTKPKVVAPQHRFELSSDRCSPARRLC